MNEHLLRLGVNIDHVATLRQARGTSYPGILDAAEAAARGGAHGITVHLREDRRHIQDADVYALKAECDVPLNLEMANVPEIVRIARDVGPDEVCLVPEKREELTTEGGLDVIAAREALDSVVKTFADHGVEVSLFIDPDKAQLDVAAALKVPVVELHTGAYCDAPAERKQDELERLVRGAQHAHENGLKVNAGHGINLQNIGGILQIPHLHTLNIGHAIVARAVFVGLEEAVREMLAAMNP